MKIMKKVTALFLCAVMVMAMGITAFAAQTYKITINNTESGYEYTAYQVFSGSLATIDGKKTLGDVKWGSEIEGSNLLTALKSSDTFSTATTDESTGAQTKVNDFADCDSAADVAEVLESKNYSAEKLDAFAGLVMKNLTSTAAGTKSVYVEKTGDVEAHYTISGLESGYYIVNNNTVPTGASASRYIVQVVDNVSVDPKTETPTITKTISDNTHKDGDYKKVNVAAIGDYVAYTVMGSIPDTTGYDYYYYMLTDTLSNGLTLVDQTITKGSEQLDYTIQVTVKTAAGETTKLIRYNESEDADNTGANFRVYKDGQTFKVAFLDMKGLQNTYGEGAEICISYYAQVNENAAVSPNANTNTANLTYSKDPNSDNNKGNNDTPGVPDADVPTGKTPDQVTKTYVTELQLTKVDGSNNALAGAEFTLTGTKLNQVKLKVGTSYVKDAENGTYYKLASGAYTATAPATDGSNDNLYADTTTKYSEKTFVTAYKEDGSEEYSVKAFVNSEGKLTFAGLTEGEYTLSESRTPEGYNTADPIEFKVTATYQNDSSAAVGGTVKWSVTKKDGSEITGISSNNNVLSTTVVNNKGSVLPSTGGIGTTIFYVAGTILVLGAAVVLIARKRMGSERA